MKYYVKCLTLILLGLSLLISECIQGDIAVKSDLSSNEEEGEILLVNVQNVAERPLRVGEKLTYKVKVERDFSGQTGRLYSENDGVEWTACLPHQF